MDSLRHKAKIGYTPGPLPDVENQEVEPTCMQSTAPYMPLNDQECGRYYTVGNDYPVLQPPNLVGSNMRQQVAPQPQLAQPVPKEENLEKNAKQTKRKIIKVLRAMRVIFVLKALAIIATLVCVFSGPPSGAREGCLALLLIGALFCYGGGIRFGRKAVKKSKFRFLNKKLRYAIINYALYWILMLLAFAVVVDLIHFRAHAPRHHGPPGRHQRPPHHPQPEMEKPVFEPIRIERPRPQPFERFEVVDMQSNPITIDFSFAMDKIERDNFIINQAFSNFEKVYDLEEELDELFKPGRPYGPITPNPRHPFEDFTELLELLDDPIFEDLENQLMTDFEVISFDDFTPNGLRNLKAEDHPRKEGKHHGNKKSGHKGKKNGHHGKGKKGHHGKGKNEHHSDKQETDHFNPGREGRHHRGGQHSFNVKEAVEDFAVIAVFIMLIDAILIALYLSRLSSFRIALKKLEQNGKSLTKNCKKNKKEKKAKKQNKRKEKFEETKQAVDEECLPEPSPELNPGINSEIDSSITSMDGMVKTETPVVQPKPVQTPSPVQVQPTQAYPPTLVIDGRTYVAVKATDLAKLNLQGGQLMA